MKSRILIVIVLSGLAAGCVDTADSVSREYRNQINEGLDAMMLVTDEPSAKRMTVRIFKPMGDRFKDIDYRLEIVKANREKKEFAAEFVNSDSVHMYVAEVYLNRGRYAIELARLKSVAKKEIEIYRDAHAKSGAQEPFDPNVACKALQDIVAPTGGVLAPLDEQLNKAPKMFGYLNTFKDWKLGNWEELSSTMQKKRERFGVKMIGELK